MAEIYSHEVDAAQLFYTQSQMWESDYRLFIAEGTRVAMGFDIEIGKLERMIDWMCHSMGEPSGKRRIRYLQRVFLRSNRNLEIQQELRQEALNQFVSGARTFCEQMVNGWSKFFEARDKSNNNIMEIFGDLPRNDNGLE